MPRPRLRRPGVELALAVAFAVSSCEAPARAQTIGGAVEDHLDENLEQQQQPRKKKRRHRRRAQPVHTAPAAPAPAPAAAAPVQAPPAEPPPKGPKEPDLPMRVIGKNLRLDPSIGIGYRGWAPQDFPAIDVEVENALTWQFEVRAQFFRLITLHRGYYESNALAPPAREDVSIAVKAGTLAPKALWVLGMIGLPIKWVLEPIIRYEARAFESTATATKPVNIVPHSARPTDDLTTYPLAQPGDQLSMTSSWETLVIGLLYHHDNDPSGTISMQAGTFPPVYFGVGLVSYAKPYQVAVGTAVLESIVFDARFQGIGLALGLDTVQKPGRPYVSVATQVGLGRVLLLEDYSLNEALPPDWLIGYGQGTLNVGYLHPLLITMPTPMVGIEASGGGATFFYFKTKAEEGEQVSTPPLNWDLLWAARAFFVLPL